MDGMTVRDFLLQPSRARVRLEMAILRRDALKSLTERVTQRFGKDSVPGAHSQRNDAMENAVIRLSEAEEAVERAKEELAQAELEVGMVLAEIQDKDLYQFMVWLYLDNIPITEVAKSMGYSYTWARHVREKGFATVQEILRNRDGC